MKKIEINLFPESLKETYEKLKADHTEKEENRRKSFEQRRADYIAEYTVYEPGYSTGFLGSWRNGRDVPRPDVGEAKWREFYGEYEPAEPMETFEEWSKSYLNLNSNGQQELIDRVNEIVEWIQKQEESNKTV